VYIPRFEEDRGRAQLVGDAYVDGLMNLKDIPVIVRGRDEMFIME